jgi:thymidylate kinase
MSFRTGSSLVSRTPIGLAGFLEALDRDDIRWSLLRPAETLALPEGDVDILVELDALERVRQILARRGFAAMPVPGPDLHAVLYDREATRFVWVHVQGALQLAGAVLPAEAVLAEADEEGGVRQPGDAWLLWILLLRALVDKGELPERHRPHVMALAQRWQGGPPMLESLARGRGIEPSEVVAAAATGDWEGVLRHSVPRSEERASWLARVVRAPARLRALRGLRDRRGLSVAVIGPDGTGKTTLVNELARSLPLPTRVQYMGLTGGRLLPKADALRVPGLVLAARIVIHWLRYLRGWHHRARGGIVLFERYTLDGAVPSGMRLSRAGRLSRRVQRWVCPLPDLVLLLDASGPTMHARSGEYDPAVLESWRVAFHRLRASVPVLEVIDAEQAPEAVHREAEARIWRRYSALRAARNGRRTVR